MKTYLLAAAGVIFLSVMVSMLIPQGKLNKTITFIMRMACIFVLIQPLAGIFKLKPSENEVSDFYDAEYVCGVYSENQSRALESALNKKFNADCECSVEIEHDNGKFVVNGVEVVLEEKYANLTQEIYAYLEEAGYINISVYAKST